MPKTKINPGSKPASVKIGGKIYALDSDLHTHTVYSHGTGSVLDNVLAAREKGVLKIGISDHGPGHIGFGVQRKRLKEQKAEIQRIREQYPEMEIYFAVEANILEGGKLDIRPEEAGFFDYICAGWHYGAIGGIRPSGMCSLFVNLARSTAEKASARQIRRNTDVVVKALEHNPVKFLTHPGDKAPVDILEVAAACARTDTLMEINTSHMSLTAADLRNIAVTEARFLISSDAHTPARVGDMVCAVKLLLDAGVALNRVVNLKVTEA